MLHSKTLVAIALGSFLLASCGAGANATTNPDGTNEGGGMTLLGVSNGFGGLLPHRIAVVGPGGMPSSAIIDITEIDDLLSNLTPTNLIMPVTEWPVETILPSNIQGNHFIYARFSQDIDVESVLNKSVAAGVDNNLTGSISVLMVDALLGVTVPVRGVGFVGGKTYGPTVDPDNPTAYLLEEWVRGLPGQGANAAQAVNGQFPGRGFPGTPLPDGSEAGFNGAGDLVRDNVFCFVVDADGDLSTYESFPAGLQIQLKISDAVFSQIGMGLAEPALASSTVGADMTPPEVMVAGASQVPIILPGNGEIDVDPETFVEVTFTEPLQLLSVGALDDGTPPALSASVILQFGPSTNQVNVPFSVMPLSVYDLSRYQLRPTYGFPGSDPQTSGAGCQSYSEVRVIVNPGQLRDLVGNVNTLAPSTSFVTRAGSGLVNAPVCPDTIYVGRGGSQQAISVIDLNGFGQGTGNPTYAGIFDPIVQGNSNFPNNPNLVGQGATMCPPLSPGTCTFDGGSSGVFTLVRDSALDDTVTGFPTLETVGDMVLGHALDSSFNNAQPFGCQAGGGNICAASGLKAVTLITGGPTTVLPVNENPFVPPFKFVIGAENLVSWAPHPNPPKIIFPPLCSSPFIQGQEPSAVDNIIPLAAGGKGLTNLLTPGPFPLGLPEIKLPPQGLLALEQNNFFEGPSVGATNLAACRTYMIRQQIGQFLYVVDRAVGEVVVFNSNNFRIIDRIRTPDPTRIAISPNLNFLVVTNQRADQVSFIDVDPGSTTFHEIVKTTMVGSGPTEVVWESSNEDIFVCNEGDGTVTIVSSFNLESRKILRNQISHPIAVVTTPRQTSFGFFRGVYFAYILNQDGRVAIFESGPDGINGIGFDDVITTLPFTFFRPKTIQPDLTSLTSAIWVVHENPVDQDGLPIGVGGAVSNVGISGGNIGPAPLDPGIFGNPQARDLEYGVFYSLGEGPEGLSGIPVDIAFDNQRNLTALNNFATQFAPGINISINGKSQVKVNSVGVTVPVSAPQFMFLAVPSPGVVDVFNIGSGTIERTDTNPFEPGTQSIPVSNVNSLMDYFRP
ncbi:MAG: hypothetical protein CMJ89_06245 [Planctomycetes bacterium]|jgi:hypothetical protein|nr:hypothetical protein [Planctomycetota bacterium]